MESKYYIRTFKSDSFNAIDFLKLNESELKAKSFNSFTIVPEEYIRVYDDRAEQYVGKQEITISSVSHDIRLASTEDMKEFYHVIASLKSESKFQILNFETPSTKDNVETKEPVKEIQSILLEAEKIVNGDRNDQYGDPNIAFAEYKNILHSTFGIELSESDICKVLMSIKLGRLKHKYKRDSIVDLCGYAEILNRLEK